LENRQKPNRLISIDILRGCAALGVVTSHCFPHELNYLAEEHRWFGVLGSIVAYGTLGVPLFFVISGFCIHQRWTKQFVQTGSVGIDFRAFWQKRIFRLYPPYFVVLCLGMAMVLTGYILGRASYYPEPRGQWIVADFIAHLFMLHGFHPLFDNGGGNPPMWTLAREEYLYLIYFILLFMRKRVGIKQILLLVTLVGLIFPTLMSIFLENDSRYWDVVSNSAPVLWIQWCLGAACVEAYYRVTGFGAWSRSLLILLLSAISALLLPIYIPGLSAPLWGVCFFIITNIFVMNEERFRGVLSRCLATVGIFSYSLYLTHYLLITIFRELFSEIAYTRSPWLALAGVLMKLALCFLSSIIFFLLIESHFQTGNLWDYLKGKQKSDRHAKLARVM
jgi:peptidoglycan/LPS O-acetylase OafA/YrhL